MPGNCRRSRHGGRDEMRAALEALAALEVAVRGRGAALFGFQPVIIHRKAHGAARLAPVKSGGNENLVEALGLRHFLDEAGARNNHRVNAGGNLFALDDFGDGAQILDAAIGAGADEHPVEP